jgi:preprotein translocase subunit SecG
MAVVGSVLLGIMILSAVLLVLVVLVQDDQGEGIGGIFGGGSNSAFGSRSGNVLTRFTAALAGVFLFCVLGLAWINRTPTAGDVVSKARQAALNGTNQQSWWVQAPPAPNTTPAPSGAASPFGSNATQGPDTANSPAPVVAPPGSSSPATTLPSPGSSRTGGQ